MTTDVSTMVDEYAVECLRQGKLLGITDINESDNLSFGEGPVYTHFGSIDRFQFKVFVEVFVWSKVDAEDILEEQGYSYEDLWDQRPL